MLDDLNQRALAYHAAQPPGKLEIAATKPMATQDDLSLAYSPGVAAPCLAIAEDPGRAPLYTGRGNLVGVVSNGTAVLGLGNIGALASKPVMEGKAVLFKRFSGINVFDIEVEEKDVDRFCEVVAGLEATFGGINLEDIKAPECFEIEKRLRERMQIPIFHDDQHGTAIVTASAIVSGLKVVGKRLEDVRVVVSGAGAAAIATLDLLVNMGMPKHNAIMLDRKGVIFEGRNQPMDPYKARYACTGPERTLDDALAGADIFLGLSGPGALKPEQCAALAPDPLILALANPDPEIDPAEAKAARPDAIICTGRSDYPNQVNNVLCFPFIFRGALDVGATEINEAMKVACVEALSALAEAEPSDVVQEAYAGQPLRFGRDYLLPKPFDPRLITQVAPAVARAAMASGVATRPIEDFPAYERTLARFVYQTSGVMEPVFQRAREGSARIAYAEGEDERVLEAAQQVVDLGLARPMLVGRREVIEERIDALGLRIRGGEDVDILYPPEHPNLASYVEEYYSLMGRKGVSRLRAEYEARSRSSVFAALMVRAGDADGMVCGAVGTFPMHLQRVRDVIGKAPEVHELSTLVLLTLRQGNYFVCDTHVTMEPSAEQLAEMTLLAAGEVRRFGLEPRVALLSHSNFGTSDAPSARRMREAHALVRQQEPQLMMDGEMHGEAAVSERVRNRTFDGSSLVGSANLLVMPNKDAAHITYTLLKQLGGGGSVGPILLGAARPANVVTESITVRGLINMTAYTVVQSQLQDR
jgi:malate dehydrogenase (oxaloacetate-decarboxylating)(NADP+)